MPPIMRRHRSVWPNRVLLAALAWVLAACSRGPTSDLIVTKFDDTNDGECTSRDCSLREAVTAANATEQAEIIHLPEGTYTLTLTGSGEDGAVSGDLDLVGEVTLRVESADDGPAPVAIVDAGSLGERAFHIVSGAATLIGFTVQGGEAEAGGAILVDPPAGLTLQQMVVQGGRATGAGGGGLVYSEGSLTAEGSTFAGGLSLSRGGGLTNIGSASLVDSVVRDNSAYELGGGIANLGTMTITGGSIQLNYAREKDYPAPDPVADGGGISNLGTLDLVNVNVTDNHASAWGGGISSVGVLHMDGGRIDYDEAWSAAALMLTGSGEATLSDVTIVGFAQADGGAIYIGPTAQATLTRLVATGKTEGDGGVIYNAGELTVAGSVIENGFADHGGGIFNSGNLTVESTTFQVDTARIEGGGIYSVGSLHLSTSTLLQNGAMTGAGLYLAGAASLENCTISGNTADTNGGGLWTGAGTIQMTHCTVTANTAPEGSGVFYEADLQLANSIVGLNVGATDCAGPGHAAGRGNLQSDGSCALPLTGNQAGVDPLLERLTSAGDLPATHGLKPGSPAIDAADSLLCLATDQRGVIRPQAGGCDSGAYEAENSTEATLVPVGSVGYTPSPGETLAVGLGPAACLSKPSTGSRTLTTMAEAQTVPISGRTEDSAWLQVIPVGRLACWVSAADVSLQGSLERVPIITP